MKKLNLGCGRNIKKNFINADIVGNKGVDLVYNLNKIPYPFKDNTFDEIFAKDILEHLKNPNEVIKELWRISKPNACIFISVPHFSSQCAWEDLTHIRPFSLLSLNHYDIEKIKKISSLNSGMSSVLFEVKAIPVMFKGWRILGFKFIAKKFPELYEKFLTFIFTIGGIHFHLKVLKN